MQEEAERKKYAKFLSQFTMENFLDKVRDKMAIASVPRHTLRKLWLIAELIIVWG